MRTKSITLSEGQAIEVRELPIGKLNKLLNTLKTLPDGIDLSKTAKASEEAIGAKMMAAIPGVIASGWDSFMDAIVASTDFSREDLDTKVSLEDGIKIVQAMIEVNNIPSVVKTIGQWFKATSLPTGSPT